MLIGLYSVVPGCGKTTVAQYLQEQHDFACCSFAAPLRAMLASLLEFAYSEEEARHLLTNPRAKEATLDRLPGKPTARHLLQSLGTGWGRSYISRDFWAALWKLRVEELLAAGDDVVADDVRFPEEVAVIRALGGQMWEVRRGDVPVDPQVIQHASEGALGDVPMDLILANNGSLEDMHTRVNYLLATYSWDERVHP